MARHKRGEADAQVLRIYRQRVRPYSISIGWSTEKCGGFRASPCTCKHWWASLCRACTVRPPIDEGELAKNDTEVVLPTDDASEDEEKRSVKIKRWYSPSFDLSG